MHRKGSLCFALFYLLILRTWASRSIKMGLERQKRLFSLFNVVTFENTACIGNNPNLDVGTCLSGNECQNEGGSKIGNCASGFGVCCLFSLVGCGGNVNRNCTVIRNAGFPSADTGSGSLCTYNFNRLRPNICQIRLDFNPTTTLPLATGVDGQCGGTGASLQVRSGFSTNPAAFPPVVCGQLSGQHMFLESGSMGNAGTMVIEQGLTGGELRYNIKVTYIPCDSLLRAPSGCTQFFTGVTGTVTSYNFAGEQLLAGHNYNNCIRQEEGFCQFSASETPITMPDPFDVDAPARINDNCMMMNYVTIPSAVVKPTGINTIEIIPSMRCGTVFGSISGPGLTVPNSLTSLPNVPFEIGVRTRPSNVIGKFGGFSLDYSQIPC